MKAIFTYPNNSGTNWVNPDYYGSIADQTGFTWRVNEYITENYIGFVNPLDPAAHSQDRSEKFLGKYINYIDTRGANYASRYGWASPSWIEGEWREHQFSVIDASYTRSAIADPMDITLTMPVITGTAWGSYNHTFSTGDTAYYKDIPLIADGSDTVDATSGSTITITQYPLAADSSKDNVAANTMWHRKGSGCWARFIESPHPFQTGDRIQMTHGFDEAHDTGTANQIATDFWIERISAFTLSLYTDSARTTPATLNEVYYNTHTINYTTGANPEIFTFSAVDFTSAPQEIRDAIDADPNGFLRVTYTVNSGSMLDEDYYGDMPITTTINYDNAFFYSQFPGSYFVTIEDGRGGVTSGFQLDANSDVDVTFHWINPAKGSTGNTFYLMERSVVLDPQGEVSPYDENGSGIRDYYLYDIDIVQYGPKQYSYTIEDPGNPGQPLVQYQADLTNSYWNPGASYGGSVNWASGEKPGITASLDGNGRLTGLTITDGGRVSSSVYAGATGNRVIEFTQPASTYIPPAGDTAAAEDVFDLNTEWADAGFNTQKTWPQHVKPRSADVSISQPSSVTRAQNGTKYVREIGYTKYSITLDYPPMTHEDWQEFNRVIEAARGQVIPFYLNLRYNDGTNLLFRRQSSISVGPRTAGSGNRALSGEKIITIDGLPSNWSGEVSQGDYFILGVNNNGSLLMTLNDVEANVFGEAKIRIPRGLQNDTGFHQRLYFTPFHAVVTLAEDAVSYTKRLDGYYEFSVTMELDEFK